MPTYQGHNSPYSILPEGDYVVAIVSVESGVSNGANTAGSPTYHVKYSVEGRGANVFDHLIDHPKTQRRLDTFIKSMGLDTTLEVGEGWDIDPSLARTNGTKFIDPIGARGWVRLQKDEYNGKVRNKIAYYYTDKARLTPLPAPPQVPFLTPQPKSVTSSDKGDEVPF